MKVIFTDIDGVLNCEATPNPREFPYIIDKRLLRRFVSLQRKTRAKVVLISSWRCDPIGLLAAKHFGIPFDDVTPDVPKKHRGEEIRSWLAKHLKVTRYAVIDDEEDGLDELPLFQPAQATGLTPEIARGVQRYLNGKTNDTMRRNVIVRVGLRVRSALKISKS
jgi:hypothetical protein